MTVIAKPLKKYEVHLSQTNNFRWRASTRVLVTAGCWKSTGVSRWRRGPASFSLSTNGTSSVRTSRNSTKTSRPWIDTCFRWTLPKSCGTHTWKTTCSAYATTCLKTRRPQYRKRWANFKGKRRLYMSKMISMFYKIPPTLQQLVSFCILSRPHIHFDQPTRVVHRNYIDTW